jgi:hypothetical protein
LIISRLIVFFLYINLTLFLVKKIHLKSRNYHDAPWPCYEMSIFKLFLVIL